MLDIVRAKAERLTHGAIVTHTVDFTSTPLALAPGSVDYVMLYNILHAENPLALLQEANRLLAPHGRVGVMHWNPDPDTPRGPPMAIRPTPAQAVRWMRDTGFVVSEHIELPPYHCGYIGRRCG